MEKKTTKSDIRCYVFLRDGNYEIPYSNVSLNNELSLKISENNCYSGFHSFKYKEEAELFLTYLGEKHNLEIEEAIIPKNSDYVEVSKGYSFPVSKEHIKMSGFISGKIKIKDRT